jgi:hypothetical protein
MSRGPEILAHLEWLGYVQPTGLLVSVPALVGAQAYVNRNIADEQRRLAGLLRERPDAGPVLDDLPAFAVSVLGWRPTDLAGGPGAEPLPTELEAVLPDYGETLRPTYAVRDPEPKDPARPWMMLVQVLPTGTDPDRPGDGDARRWNAAPQAKFERLLRETAVPIGLLCDGTRLRLVYAPRGEGSGWADFRFADMAAVAGRPILAALHMLLSAERLFVLDARQRLPWILAESRRYQNDVSTRLAGQVLAALFELLRGFQAADDVTKGRLLGDVLADDPDAVYGGLLTVLLRTVFLLFAEDRGLVSGDPVYTESYSVTGLFERLRADAGRHPDTMDQRFGAWAQLVALFRLIHRGGRHGGFRLPARKGFLFDPDRYPFLEGRGRIPPRPDEGEGTGVRGDPAPAGLPRVSDGVVLRVLSNLVLLDGERLSYRGLDVEQIGSVYEAVMGFGLHRAAGRSIAVKPVKSGGAPVTVDLDALLAVAPVERARRLTELTGQKLAGAAADALKKAARVEDLLAALDRKIARELTPEPVPPGGMVLQPSEERRRSGTHYTPRTLTGPIVRKTLEPVLRGLGERPAPEQILDLKVCDPAMGSGAFLVEACRFLAEELAAAWAAHGRPPAVPPDEDELLHARRLIAQRCLYGVDKNPMAVDLAKLSLWLATPAKDHPFTFLDHSLRCGDSLVGLTREQIVRFDWDAKTVTEFEGKEIAARIAAATDSRRRILDARDQVPYPQLEQELQAADAALDHVRFVGDLAVSSYFAADKDKARWDRRNVLFEDLRQWRESLSPAPGKTGPDTAALGVAKKRSLDAARDALVRGDRAVRPFHWEIEFPEVFARPQPGFDAVVGNPPFAGKNTLIAGNRDGFVDWLKELHPESHGNADLVAHFFRRAFVVLRPGGCFGLIATKTIGQGDTRTTGLRWICTHGGTIYSARKRYKWPGEAAVIVSVVHVRKGAAPGPCELDGRPVPVVTAYLFHAGGHDDPARLRANEGKSFIGSIVLGMGFTFDDTDTKGVASPLALMHELIAKDPRNAERIFPYIGGEEVNDSPTHAHHRFVINFGDMSEDEARRWPDLMRIVEEKVKPQREKDNRDVRRRYWWRFGETTPALFAAIRGRERVLVISRVGEHGGFAFLPNTTVFSEQLVVFSTSDYTSFSLLQCRPHDVWSRFFGSSLESRFRYTPSDCFETFPFPENFETNPALEAAGKEYYEFRAALMVERNEGLTKTYNRFHDPDETDPKITRLRELHAAMDRAVLDAYGWTDLRPTCGFLLDYEDDPDDDADRETGGRSRRKPWRFRWPDDVRDEVLARLLDLNKRRAEIERLTGLTSVPSAAAPAKKKAGRRKGKGADEPGLFG